MKPINIKTSYGKFPTMIHFERYWKKKMEKAIKLKDEKIKKLNTKLMAKRKRKK